VHLEVEEDRHSAMAEDGCMISGGVKRQMMAAEMISMI